MLGKEHTIGLAALEDKHILGLGSNQSQSWQDLHQLRPSSEGFLPMLAIAVLGLGMRLAAAATAAVYRKKCNLLFAIPSPNSGTKDKAIN